MLLSQFDSSLLLVDTLHVPGASGACTKSRMSTSWWRISWKLSSRYDERVDRNSLSAAFIYDMELKYIFLNCSWSSRLWLLVDQSPWCGSSSRRRMKMASECLRGVPYVLAKTKTKKTPNIFLLLCWSFLYEIWMHIMLCQRSKLVRYIVNFGTIYMDMVHLLDVNFWCFLVHSIKSIKGKETLL